MKRVILLALAFIVLNSCKSESEKREVKKHKDLLSIRENLLAYINGTIAEEKEDLVIDSIHIIRIDTLTEKQDSIASIISNLEYFKRLSKIRDNNDEMVKIKERQLELSKSLDIDGNSYNKELGILLNKSFDYNTELMNLGKYLGTLDSLTKSSKLDSIKQTGLEAIVKIYAHDSKQVNQNVDSLGFYLDNNFRINKKHLDRKQAKIN